MNGETTTGLMGRPADRLDLSQAAVLHGIKGYDKRDQDDLIWLVGYIHDQLGGSRREAQEALKVDGSTMSRVLLGTYGASIEKFMERVRHLRKKVSSMRNEFVETTVTRKLFQAFELAKNMNAIVHISGPSGSSKTASAREWQRRNHGRAVYVDCPVIGGIRALLQELARNARINVKNLNTAELIEKVTASFDSRHTILLDEATRLLPHSRNVDTKPLEFLRRMHDVAGVGIAFISTDIFRKEVTSGAWSQYLEQLLGRIEEPLRVPEKVGANEAADVCRAFNPDADLDIISLARRIANGEELNEAEDRGRILLLFTLMRHAKQIADDKGEPVQAKHLKAAQVYRNGLVTWAEEE